MLKLPRSSLRLWVVLGALLPCAGAALAALGGLPQPPTSASLTSTPSGRPLQSVPVSGAYTVSAATLPTGTVVSEFINAAGQVFAVSWTGPVLPDLATLLGGYFAEYQAVVQRQRAAGQRGGVVQTQSTGLVMVSRGRMGQFQGYAYVPALVPAQVDIQVLLP